MLQRLLLLLLLLTARLGAVTILEGPAVVTTPSGQSALRWRTDVPAGGTVRFGESVDRLDQKATDPKVSDLHEVPLGNLKTSTRYYYSVGTAKKSLIEGSFRTGDPFTFQSPPTGRAPIVPVFEKMDRLARSAYPTKPPTAPPSSQTWGNPTSLPDHFLRHGADFAAKNAEDYAAQAWLFRERAVREVLPMLLDSDGTVRAFDQATGTFAAYNRSGTTKTFFKPGRRDYFARQPGHPIKTPPWISP